MAGEKMHGRGGREENRSDPERATHSGADWWLYFRAMVREERRLHTELFGGRRFAFLPAFVWVGTALAVAAMQFTGTQVSEIAAGAHALVLGFGLYTGTAGLVGDDLLDRVLGETSMVLSVVGFLPVSRRRLLGVFVVKDAVYYAALFIFPLALGFAPVVASGALTPTALAGLWVSLSLVFAVGMTVTFTLVAVRTRGVPGWLLGLTAISLLGAIRATGNGNVLWNSVVVSEPLHALGLVAATLTGGALALRVYDPTFREPATTVRAEFTSIARRVDDDTGLVTRTLLDLARSSGGVLKPVVSTAVLFGLTAFLLDVAARIVGVTPSPGIFFGSMLGLSAFTTYSWLTQFDAIEEYLVLPVTVPQVFRAKRIAFLLVGLPTGAVAYGVACVLYDVQVADAVLGAALFVGLSLYLFGLTVYLAGLDPNEFLFDAVRFALLTVGIAVPIVPVLLVGFAIETAALTATLASAIFVASMLFASVGTWLAARAGPRWETAYLAG